MHCSHLKMAVNFLLIICRFHFDILLFPSPVVRKCVPSGKEKRIKKYNNEMVTQIAMLFLLL